MADFFLDDATFAAFQEYIRELTGIHYTAAKRYLLDTRVRKRALESGLTDGPAYLDFLKSADVGRAEIEQLIDQVSVHETSFFRHPRQIDIARELLQELITQRRKKGPRRLRLWSAACSSGEEPFSLALVIHELLGSELSSWQVDILGTDISVAVVARASTARFSRRSVQTVPESLLAAHFHPVDGDPHSYDLDQNITRMVNFRALSLLDESRMRAIRDQDLILCRNVLIYFDENAKRKVIASLHDALRPGGYLALGPAESLHGLSSALQRTPYSVHNYYRRPPAEEQPRVESAISPTRESTISAERKPASAPAQEPSAPARTPPPKRQADWRARSLITRIDAGLKGLKRDYDNALGKTIGAAGDISDTVQELLDAQTEGPLRSHLSRVNQHLARMLLYLQVADRGDQKLEALRGLLQELSDRLLPTQADAPDLRVRTVTYDDSILSDTDATEEPAQKDDEALSQNDIDALFN